MAGRYGTEGFLKKQVEVEDPSRTMTFGPESRRKGRPFDSGTENLYFLGLPGSGRKTLAKAAAMRFGLEYVDLTADAATEQALAALLTQSGKCAVLGRRSLKFEGVQETLARSRTYFLMADMPFLLRRLDGDESLRPAIIKDLQDLEPACMALARHLLRAEADQADLLAQIEATLAMPA